jgi:DNA-binding YbaB/EbfC family protein
MLGMFKQLGQLKGLLDQLPKFKEEMENLQKRLGQITAEGDAGGGMVRFRVSGKLEVLGCTLSEEAMQLNDREMLEDLIRAAANQAIDRARHKAAEETSRTASGFGMPMGGLELPSPPDA